MSETPANGHEQTSWVLVTGASRNIGAHLAHRFLDMGYGVLAHYRSETDATRALAARGAQLVQGELTETRQCLALAAKVEAHTDTLRAIVHNASAYAPTPGELRDAAAAFEAYFQVHMLGPYLLSRRLAPLLQGRLRPNADIIHITDIQADDPPADYDIYCATKAGLQSLTLSLARRFAPTIKVNAIQPGPISTLDDPTESGLSEIQETTLVGRMGTSEAIWQAVRALLDNDFQTGAIVPVDGGRRLTPKA